MFLSDTAEIELAFLRAQGYLHAWIFINGKWTQSTWPTDNGITLYLKDKKYKREFGESKNPFFSHFLLIFEDDGSEVQFKGEIKCNIYTIREKKMQKARMHALNIYSKGRTIPGGYR